jgi:hypothetical protein
MAGFDDPFAPCPTHGWWGHQMLASRHPGLFTTVIGRSGPQSVWLALPLPWLTGALATRCGRSTKRLTSPI